MKSLKDIMNFVKINCKMQVTGVTDVAVPYLMGPPGGGKTASIKEICASNNWSCVDKHFALIPIEEIGGIPQFTEENVDERSKGTIWSIPELITELWEKSKENKEIIVCFLDDFHICSVSHYNLCFELFKRELRGHKLPRNTAFILAGNPSAKAASRSMPSFLVNRVCLLNIYTDYEEWKTHFAFKNVNPKILSFLGHEKYKKYFHEEEKMGQPWASPRSWTRLSHTLDEMEKNHKLSNSELLYFSSAFIGGEAAQQFVEYDKLYSEFPMKAIFNQTEKIRIPKDYLKMYIYRSAAISEFIDIMLKKKTNKDAVSIFSKILAGFFDAGNSELIIASMKELLMALPNVDTYNKVEAELEKINPAITKRISDDVEELSNI